MEYTSLHGVPRPPKPTAVSCHLRTTPARGSTRCPVTSDRPQLAAEGRECPVDWLCEIGNNVSRMDPLAEQLKRLRAARGLSQEALAKKAHVSRGYLARIELGRHDPTLSVLRRLAKGLRVSVGELVK